MLKKIDLISSRIYRSLFLEKKSTTENVSFSKSPDDWNCTAYLYTTKLNATKIKMLKQNLLSFSKDLYEFFKKENSYIGIKISKNAETN